ncbi:MAG TPA: hypothetical protein PK720_00255 [bacterium]|nr:hypothetical protein [bacterium]
MKRKKEYQIDMTDFGPVIDKEGSWDKCLDNLERLLIYFYREFPDFKKNTKVLILKSFVIDTSKNGDNPERINESITRTIKTLLKEYRSWNCNKDGFNLSAAEKNQSFRFACYQKDGEKNSAWGPFIYTTRVNRAIKRAQKIIKEEEKGYEHQKRIEKRLKQENIYNVLQPFL